MSDFTEDAFLGGKITLRQPVKGYRAGADPVFLAAAVPAKPRDSVLELGCGSGVALLCLNNRVSGLHLTGVERDADVADLARKNLTDNRATGDIVTADIAALPNDLRNQTFDHLLANPPFFNRQEGSAAPEAAREKGRGEETPLAQWVDIALRRVKPKGSVTFIQRAERLPDLLAAIDDRLGDLVALPLAPRLTRAAKLIILQGRKGANGPFRMAPPFVLHKGERHLQDGDSYTEEAQSILRNGQAFSKTMLSPA